jgi:hypothetical protein
MGGKHRLTALNELAPQWAHYPLVVLATVATVSEAPAQAFPAQASKPAQQIVDGQDGEIGDGASTDRDQAAVGPRLRGASHPHAIFFAGGGVKHADAWKNDVRSNLRLADSNSGL